MSDRDEFKVLDSREVFQIGSVRCSYEKIYEYHDSGTSLYPGREERYSRFVFVDQRQKETVWEVQIGDTFSVVLGPGQTRTVLSEKVPKGKQKVTLLNRAGEVTEQFDIYIS